MAQTLLENHSYKLLTTEEIFDNRHVYFVKLTDSCLKAIEEHVTSKRVSHAKAAVKFEGANGVLSIPSKPGSTRQNDTKNFNFTVSNFPVESNPLQGILECIKHADVRTDRLVSYGPLQCKISIAATDDVYENTRNRMAQVDHERKEIRTKEIEIGSRKKGSKTKQVIRPVDVRPAADKKPASLKKKVINHAPNSPKRSAFTSTASSSSINNQHSSPIGSSNRSSPVTVGKSFSCRERVVHILAIGPHEKSKLLRRLTREAFSQKDRNNLAMVLQQVSSVHDNQHKLHSHLYSEVQVNTWPFYSDSERLDVKRNITAHAKQENTSPQVVSSTSKSPEEKPAIKRPVQNEVTSSNKRARLEIRKADEPSSTSSLNSNKKTKKEESVPTQSKSLENKNSNFGEDSPPTVASTSDTPEYMITYKPITSYEQRCRYKRDFQSEYSEYIELKKNVDAVATKFMELDRSWRRLKKGSPEYQKIQDEIIEAYQQQQKDEKYHEMKRRCEELHQKLSHIKKLVVEYDSALHT
ncbi:RNA polymerase II elongation factor ELL-like [Hydractinia symbiolongicarpus]|uniref:RNA polymerase II elongation factor ELL-like n=1 Tax=Hydractinia symbiolongicarpus TaxID=13093 RepID=UPI00254F3201|nr:RNA polymerase II elongation factor ELL-like [Hydractinia symbiolongicarpus]